jgi:hypothetical protein
VEKPLALITSYSPWQPGEGPTDQIASNTTPFPNVIPKAPVPDANQRESITASQSPPPNFNYAFKSKQSFKAALGNLRNSSDPEIAVVPEIWRHIFHTKGATYSHHSDVNLNIVLFDRQAKAASPPSPSVEAKCDEKAALSGIPFDVFRGSSSSVYDKFCDAADGDTKRKLTWNVDGQ